MDTTFSYLGATPEYGAFEKQTFTGDGSTTDFDLDYPISTSTQILVSVNSVIQEPDVDYNGYTTNGQGRITFTNPVTAGHKVFLIYMGRQLLTATQALSSPHIDEFSGDGSTTIFTLTRIPSVGNASNVLVFINGVFKLYGSNKDYVTSGDSLVFNSAPTNGASISVIQLAETNNVINTVLDNSVTNSKLSLSYSTTVYTGDGNTSAFSIQQYHTVDSILVFYNGVCMKPTIDYTIANNILTFTFTPINNSDIVFRYLPI